MALLGCLRLIYYLLLSSYWSLFILEHLGNQACGWRNVTISCYPRWMTFSDEQDVRNETVQYTTQWGFYTQWAVSLGTARGESNVRNCVTIWKLSLVNGLVTLAGCEEWSGCDTMRFYMQWAVSLVITLGISSFCGNYMYVTVCSKSYPSQGPFFNVQDAKRENKNENETFVVMMVSLQRQWLWEWDED